MNLALFVRRFGIIGLSALDPKTNHDLGPHQCSRFVLGRVRARLWVRPIRA